MAGSNELIDIERGVSNNSNSTPCLSSTGALGQCISSLFLRCKSRFGAQIHEKNVQVKANAYIQSTCSTQYLNYKKEVLIKHS
jgi:hypothetical protein